MSIQIQNLRYGQAEEIILPFRINPVAIKGRTPVKYWAQFGLGLVVVAGALVAVSYAMEALFSAQVVEDWSMGIALAALFALMLITGSIAPRAEEGKRRSKDKPAQELQVQLRTWLEGQGFSDADDVAFGLARNAGNEVELDPDHNPFDAFSLDLHKDGKLCIWRWGPAV